MKKDNLHFIEKSLSYPKIVEIVEEVSERIWYKLSDPSSFEYACYTAIGQAIMKSNEVRSVEGLARYIANRMAAKMIKERDRRKNKIGIVYFDDIDLNKNDKNAEKMKFEPEDTSTDVESEVIAKEMAALLGQGDQRKIIILGNWINGNFNDSDISRSLGRMLNGNTESHRKFITRFRGECRKRIATVV